MYLPAHFAESRPGHLQRLIREHPFGLLVTQPAGGGVEANAIPFVYDADEASEGGLGVLRAHVARANPVWREARADVDALVVFQGAQAYVSPGWYPSKAEHGKVVPTWNYLMVQARGRLRAIEDAPWLHAFVTRLTDRHEAERAEPWAVTDAPAPFVDSMLKAIVGIEIPVASIQGKWKASQNRSVADHAGVLAGLEGEAATADAKAMARAMRE